MDLEKIKSFLINECGFKSLEDARKNGKKLNMYPLLGEIKEKRLNRS